MSPTQSSQVMVGGMPYSSTGLPVDELKKYAGTNAIAEMLTRRPYFGKVKASPDAAHLPRRYQNRSKYLGYGQLRPVPTVTLSEEAPEEVSNATE